MTSESLARQHERKQDHADGFQAGWHAALQRVSEGDSVTKLRDSVPDTAPAYRADRDRLAAQVERLTAALQGIASWVEREAWTPPDSYSGPDTEDGTVVTTADLLVQLRAALAEAPTPAREPASVPDNPQVEVVANIVLRDGRVAYEVPDGPTPAREESPDA